MFIGMRSVDPLPVDAGLVDRSQQLRRELRRQRRLRSLSRTLATIAVWTLAMLGAAWLMLAGIAGFAHA